MSPTRKPAAVQQHRRRNDDLPGGKRNDDIEIVVPWLGFSYKGSGRIFVLIISAFVFPGVLAGGLLYGFQRLSSEHTELIKAVNLNTYVNSLTEARKLELDLMEPEEIRRMRRQRQQEQQR